MWILTIRSPAGEPKQHTLQKGNNTIGRMSGNDIVILDPSASRYHAKVVFDPDKETIFAYDLGSTNGTYVNRDRLTFPRPLQINDVIRIGTHLIELSFWDEKDKTRAATGPHNAMLLTRDLILESLDQHAVLLSEVASRLNNMLDLDSALSAVSNMMKVAMGADRCEVLLEDQFDNLSELGFARSIAQQAIQQRSAVIMQDAQTDPAVGESAALLNIHAALCVPIITADKVLGLIYVFKNRPGARPFDQRDIQLAVAIGHQASLTIQRMLLLQRVREEEVISKLLQRFLSPQEAEYVVKEYLETGQLPPFEGHTLTILAADICESTKLAERLGAQRFSKILNNYYQEMTNIVFDNGGMLNKYIDDGLMAVFGMPNQPAAPEGQAVNTALEFVKRVTSIVTSTGESLLIGVGIHTGPAMAGYLGTQDYVEFSVIGSPVNIAWGLEALARPNRILIGEPTYQAISDEYEILDIGVVELKSSNEQIQAYEVLGDKKQ